MDDDESCRHVCGNVELPKRKHDRSHWQLRLNIGFGTARRSDVLPVQQRRAPCDERGFSKLLIGDELEWEHVSGSAIGNPDPCESFMHYRGWIQLLQRHAVVDDDESRGHLVGDVELPECKHNGRYGQLRLDLGLSALQQSHVLSLQQLAAPGDERGLFKLRFRDNLERKHMLGADNVGDSHACKSFMHYRRWFQLLQRHAVVDDDESIWDLIGDVELPECKHNGRDW